MTLEEKAKFIEKSKEKTICLSHLELFMVVQH